jgi:hypothetical protein
VAEDVAGAVHAPADLPSRGAMALLHTLQLAADKAGHTHLPWNVLLTQTLRLMSSSGAPLRMLAPFASSAPAASMGTLLLWSLLLPGCDQCMRCTGAGLPSSPCGEAYRRHDVRH